MIFDYTIDIVYIEYTYSTDIVYIVWYRYSILTFP